MAQAFTVLCWAAKPASKRVTGAWQTSLLVEAYMFLMQALVKELADGKLPLIRASGPFGCSLGHRWGAHKVLVIFVGGLGLRERYMA